MKKIIAVIIAVVCFVTVFGVLSRLNISTNNFNVSALDPVLIQKTVTENGTYSAEDDNADGYLEVTVNVPIPSPVLIEKTVTANGVYSTEDDNADGYSSVSIEVPNNVDMEFNVYFGATPPTDITKLWVETSIMPYSVEATVTRNTIVSFRKAEILINTRSNFFNLIKNQSQYGYHDVVKVGVTEVAIGRSDGYRQIYPAYLYDGTKKRSAILPIL